MEWKKENMSRAQLEQMQREYTEKALAMQKSARLGEYSVMTGEELRAAYEAERPQPAEEAAACDETVFVPDEEEQPEVGCEAYTDAPPADGAEGEGLRQASEILEEMTRQTEIMKKLVEEKECVGQCGECDSCGSLPASGENEDEQ